jgi:hypothetical protein
VNCEEEMREKNEMGGGMCVSGGEEEKRKARGYMGGGEKKKKKEKQNGEWGLRVWWEKRGSEKERRKKNFEREKTKLVLFVCSLCLVQNVEL